MKHIFIDIDTNIIHGSWFFNRPDLHRLIRSSISNDIQLYLSKVVLLEHKKILNKHFIKKKMLK